MRAQYAWRSRLLLSFMLLVALSIPVQMFRIQHSEEAAIFLQLSQINATELAEWVLHDQLNVRVQLQLHKLLWGDVPGK